MKKHPQKEVDRFCTSLARKVPGSTYRDNRFTTKILPCYCIVMFGGCTLFAHEQDHGHGSACRWVTDRISDHKKSCKERP